jgi:hypothetical protein
MTIVRTPLPTTLEEAYAYAQRVGRIVPWRDLHLTCKNHPRLVWSTKNIDFIGARGIFFMGVREEREAIDSLDIPVIDKVNLGAEASRRTTECPCPPSDLIIDPPFNWQELVIPHPIIVCSCCGIDLHECRMHNSTHCRDCFDSHCGYDAETCLAGRERLRSN